MGAARPDGSPAPNWDPYGLPLCTAQTYSDSIKYILAGPTKTE